MVDERIEAALAGLWTSCLGVVTKVDHAKYRVDARPKVKLPDEAGALQELPIVQDVRIAMSHGKNFSLILPVAEGDVGLLVFSKYPLQELVKDSKTRDPALKRRFSVNDCVYVPFTWLDAENAPAHNANDLHIVNTAGDIYLKAKNIRMEKVA